MLTPTNDSKSPADLGIIAQRPGTADAVVVLDPHNAISAELPDLARTLADVQDQRSWCKASERDALDATVAAALQDVANELALEFTSREQVADFVARLAIAAERAWPTP